MRLKSFHGTTLADAMRQVRAALGEDAIIVTTRDDDGGGIRVTAALEDAPPPAHTKPISFSSAAPYIQPSDNDMIDHIADALHYHGINAAIAETLLSTAMNVVEDNAHTALTAACAAHFRYLPLLETQPIPKPIVLVGPPGAGKTLTIAKLATAAKLRGQRLTVITSDLERAGGVDQLAAFTRLLDVPLLETDQPAVVRDMLAELSGQQLVLVDTAGRNPYLTAEREACQNMLGKTPCAVGLVLPCGYDVSDGIELARAFSSLGADRLILTRADLARRYGSMLSIAHHSGLALSALSQTSHVATPMQTLQPDIIAHLLLQPTSLLSDSSVLAPSVRPL